MTFRTSIIVSNIPFLLDKFPLLSLSSMAILQITIIWYEYFPQNKKSLQFKHPLLPPLQAKNHTSLSVPSSDQLQALQHVLSQLGIQAQPTKTLNAQALFTNSSGSNHCRGQNNRCGQGNFKHNQGDFNNKNQGEVNCSQFSWDFNQNTFFWDM